MECVCLSETQKKTEPAGVSLSAQSISHCLEKTFLSIRLRLCSSNSLAQLKSSPDAHPLSLPHRKSKERPLILDLH
ncbi:hypothetical protein SRHO_G00237720 [Serrasalmus rhombeus]